MKFFGETLVANNHMFVPLVERSKKDKSQRSGIVRGIALLIDNWFDEQPSDDLRTQLLNAMRDKFLNKPYSHWLQHEKWGVYFARYTHENDSTTEPSWPIGGITPQSE